MNPVGRQKYARLRGWSCSDKVHRRMNNDSRWKANVTAFKAYVRRFGDGRVPANWKENLELGRWVAMLRYRRKIRQLTPDTIAELDKLGFMWSPNDLDWNKTFKKLLLFRARFKHCNVPSGWPNDPNLTTWVAHQRRLHKLGVLLRDRTQRLEKIGFLLKIYGYTEEERFAMRKHRASSKTIATRRSSGERVYNIGANGYVQYGGYGTMPAALQSYLNRNDNEWPPYIPLPRQPTRYVLHHEGFSRAFKVAWKGHGPLPAEILDYLNENGALPPSALR